MESRKVAELPEGKAFGELAIMEKTLKPRKATIKTVETSECYLATLERKEYQLILGHILQEVTAELNFFADISIFKDAGWTKRAFQTVLKNFQKFSHIRGYAVYKEGDPCDEVYIIKSGEVKCTKAVQVSQPSKNFVIDENSSLYPFEEVPSKKMIEISLLSAGQIFGEEETFLKFSNDEKSKKKKKTLQQRALYDELIHKEDPQVLKENERFIYMKNSGVGEIKRETTMVVTSMTAEIWKIPSKVL